PGRGAHPARAGARSEGRQEVRPSLSGTEATSPSRTTLGIELERRGLPCYRTAVAGPRPSPPALRLESHLRYRGGFADASGQRIRFCSPIYPPRPLFSSQQFHSQYARLFFLTKTL